MFKTFIVAGEHTSRLESGVEGKSRRFLEENPRANSSDVLEFISMQPDFMEDVALSDAV